jgi:DUF1680 family protein
LRQGFLGRCFAASCLVLALVLGARPAIAQQNPAGLAKPGTAAVADQLTPALPSEVAFAGGMLGDRVTASERNRLLQVDENDLLDAFERRDAPHQDWQGEHVGKFLHAATQAWRNTHDTRLKAKLDRVVTRLLKTQEADGYLGTYPVRQRWTSWDVWVHKYDLLGLLTYYQYTHTLPHAQNAPDLPDQALQACRRVGDLLIRTFGTGPGQRDINQAGYHQGMAATSVLEPVVLLYRATGDARYLEFGRYIVRNYDAPGGPAILASLEQYHSVRRVANGKAYEMLSNLNGLLELYRATGDRRLLDDIRIAWEDVVHNRLYITGSASSYEVFQDEYHLPNTEHANICETCVTVTWEQLNLQLLRLTGESRYADQLERSIYNHLLAAQKPTGDEWSYYTPLEGHKPFGNATNCCLSSGPRGVALIPSIAFMTSNDGGLTVNLYNSGTFTTRVKSGRAAITVATHYPLSGDVVLRIQPERVGQRFPLRLRIPAWTPRATVDGKPVTPGAYAVLNRAWRKGEQVRLEITLPTRLIPGDHENAGKAAVVRGPLVLALDTAQNPEARALKHVLLASDSAVGLTLTPAPQRAVAGEYVFRTEGALAGKGAMPLYLTPYATAGQDGVSRFEVWIPLPGNAAARPPASLFSGDAMAASRRGNVQGDITDDDPDTFSVTFDGTRADEDWFEVRHTAPVRIRKVVFMHGHTFHDGGWFDTRGGAEKPRIQIRSTPSGEWVTVATLDSYPATTATSSAGLRDGQSFAVTFPPVEAIAIRVVGRPACGDSPAQAFSSCAELEGFE